MTIRRWLLTVLPLFLLACATLSAPFGAPLLGAGTPDAAQRSRDDDADPAGTGDQLCAGTFGYGLACLDADGWHISDRAGGQLGSDQVTSLAFCPDGRLLVAHSGGLRILPGPGQDWLEMDLSAERHIEHLLCTPDSQLWGYDFDTLLRFQAGFWIPTPLDQIALDTGEPQLVSDLEPGLDGALWAVATDSLATTTNAGRDWRVYGEGQDWQANLFIDQVAVDSRNRVWLAATEGIYRFENGGIRLEAEHDLYSASEMRISEDGALWIATSDGVVVYHNDGTWQSFRFARQGLASDNIRDLAIDARGRVWAATDWGLLVLADGAWRAFHMHDSELPGNFIMSLAVSGRGPDLPEPLTREPGSLSGRLVQAGQPVSGAALELCVEYLSSIFETPCAGQPFVARALTRSDGAFTFQDLPVGYYYLAAQVDGEWQDLTEAGHPARVEAGEETSLGDVGE